MCIVERLIGAIETRNAERSCIATGGTIINITPAGYRELCRALNVPHTSTLETFMGARIVVGSGPGLDVALDS